METCDEALTCSPRSARNGITTEGEMHEKVLSIKLCKSYSFQKLEIRNFSDSYVCTFANKMSDECIQSTMAVLQRIISKPKLTESLLKKPPFRFIYDIVLELSRVTGFGNDLFVKEEFQADQVKIKENKISFLLECVQLAESVLNLRIDVNPQKVVSGLEFERTNLFLQLFASAALSQNVSDDSVSPNIVSHERTFTSEDEMCVDPVNAKNGLSESTFQEKGGKLVNQLFDVVAISANNDDLDSPNPEDDSKAGSESTGKFSSLNELHFECQKIRDHLQSASKIIIPLGKSVDYIHEDMESMNNELKFWMREIQVSLTNERDIPYVTDFESGVQDDIEGQIVVEKMSISNLRCAIFHNDKIIYSMLIDM